MTAVAAFSSPSSSSRPPSSPSSEGSPSTGITTPEPERSPLDDDDNDKEDFTTEYTDDLPPLPVAPPVKQLAIDAGTPDAWVERDERMVRLTGKHPYNCEAPVADLYRAGFLTPQSLFYVRSHGATPRVSEAEASSWRLRIHGLVRREASFTIADLKRLFPTVTLPITLVCAGNRRREQNMVTKGLGFNWGSSGVSTGLFTGVYLADVLAYCRPIRPMGAFPYTDDVGQGRARHVIFEGADELPKGKYGTSQRLQWAADRSKGMLLAWGLNGEPLSPDHGYPLRLVVPGQIGGRMVKWLNRIEVSDRESQHFLHFYDNKVLPAEVSADQARAEDHWWKDPKYIINDLNINAACSTPAHNESVPIDWSELLKVGGYAYTGGGKRVHRVEVSLDEGRTWKTAELDWPEDRYRIRPIRDHPFFGELDLTQTEMSFAWCFWELKLDRKVLAEAPCITVRATDEGLATMPDTLIWNAMGMMNNCWFRVAVHRSDDGKDLTFEHPTVPGTGQGGWMERLNDQGLDPRHPKFFKSNDDEHAEAQVKPVKKEKVDLEKLMTIEANLGRTVTGAEMEAHTNEERPWFVVNGHVYDGTEFLEKHPGGKESITLVAGEDCSEDFNAVHSIDAKKQLAAFHIGRVGSDTLKPVKVIVDDDDESAPFLNNKVWKRSKLVEKKIISHDARIFRFALNRPDQLVGLPTGQHVYVRVKDKEGQWVQRAYTPFSGNELLGYLDILIKVYQPCEGFAGGKMTCLLDALEVGQGEVELKGPTGHFTFLGNSTVRIDHEQRKIKNVAMIAGGSGITPIWSTLKALIDDEASSDVQIWILDANRTESDILAREELEGLVERSQGRIRIWHILSADDVPPEWSQGRGRPDTECLSRAIPPPGGKETLALLCGPPPMEKAVLASLAELGWASENIVKF